MIEQNWTKETPSETGFYWCKYPDNNILMVHVKSTATGVCLKPLSNLYPFKEGNKEWFGPLFPPAPNGDTR